MLRNLLLSDSAGSSDRAYKNDVTKLSVAQLFFFHFMPVFPSILANVEFEHMEPHFSPLYNDVALDINDECNDDSDVVFGDDNVNGLLLLLLLLILACTI